MKNRVLTIAAHEYITNVRRKEFILITLGLPLLMFAIGGIGGIGMSAVVRDVMRGGVKQVGVIDRSGRLNLRAAETDSGFRIRPYDSVEAGQEEVISGAIEALVVVAPDYVRSGNVDVYRKSGGIFSRSESIPIRHILSTALMAGTKTDRDVGRRIIDPLGGGATTYVFDKGRFTTQNPAREAARFVVPYVFSILLVTSIFVSASYLLRGIAEEKENRVIEVILSSVTAEELLRGKLIGLAGVGLTQVGIWLGLGYIGMQLGVAAIPGMDQVTRLVNLSPLVILQLILFFALGFALFASLMAGLGALGTSYRETQQISGIVSILAFLPFFVLAVLLQYPNGTVARVFSLIPFTAPTTMAIRLTITEIPLWEIALSALFILISVWLIQKLAAKLFRFGLLIYGKRPSLSETIRWLRQS
jgi:ABC-2 type transport system permease protein